MSETPPRPSLGRLLGGLAQDLTAIVGAVAITAGVSWIYRPAGLVAGGMFLLVAAWLSARKGQG